MFWWECFSNCIDLIFIIRGFLVENPKSFRTVAECSFYDSKQWNPRCDVTLCSISSGSSLQHLIWVFFNVSRYPMYGILGKNGLCFHVKINNIFECKIVTIFLQVSLNVFWALKRIFLQVSLNMFWALKRTVSSRQFLWVPTTYVWLRNKKNKFQICSLIWRPGITYLKVDILSIS